MRPRPLREVFAREILLIISCKVRCVIENGRDAKNCAYHTRYFPGGFPLSKE